MELSAFSMLKILKIASEKQGEKQLEPMFLWVINLQSKNHKRIGKQFFAAVKRRGSEARSASVVGCQLRNTA
jgi:hypothetical protein